MSEIKVNSIKGVSATSAAISINNTDGTCTANLTNRTNKNLVINGAMQVAQRGTSTTDQGYLIDRFDTIFSGTDEAPTIAHVDVAAGTTPYTLGFRKALKITNGNQTSGAGAGDYMNIRTILEAQDVVQSGWNVTSSSSNITLSFWVKSSVAQNFYGYIRTMDGTNRTIAMETGSLSADTWTKVTKVIQGDSNITINNDNGAGLQINFGPFWGTDRSDNSVSLTAWRNYGTGFRTKDATTTWYTTNDATFEITGVQLEVGSVATDFEHRSFGQELALCQRYYFKRKADPDYASGGATMFAIAYNQDQYYANGIIDFPVSMRTEPDALEQTGTATDYRIQFLSTNTVCNGVPTFGGATLDNARVIFVVGSGLTAGQAVLLRSNSSSAYLAFSAEL